MKVVPILVPSRTLQGAPGSTIATLYTALYSMNREPVYVQKCGFGYANVRTALFIEAATKLGRETARGFLLDDDLLILDLKQLKDAIRMADEQRWNIVAPYRLPHGPFSIAFDKTRCMTEQEVAKLRPYEPVFGAGLGFYYGTLPLTYKFKEFGEVSGEDVNFFIDNKLEARCAPVTLKHLKVMPI